MRARALILLLAAGACVLLWQYTPSQSHGDGDAQIGGTFTLTDTKGHRIQDSDFRGRPMLVYMGFTNCPDLCPTMLATLSNALKTLGPDASKVTPIFITLDPAHDTPKVLAQYLSAFDPHIIGLTGTEQEVRAASQAYKAYYAKVNTSETYTIDHSGFLYLMDLHGKYVKHFQPNVKPDEIVKAVKELL